MNHVTTIKQISSTDALFIFAILTAIVAIILIMYALKSIRKLSETIMSEQDRYANLILEQEEVRAETGRIVIAMQKSTEENLYYMREQIDRTKEIVEKVAIKLLLDPGKEDGSNNIRNM